MATEPMGAHVIRFESSTLVERPADEVFACLTDLTGYRRWMHRDGVFGRVEVTSAPPLRAGTTYVDHTRMGRFVGEVTDHVPGERVAFSETLHWFGYPLTTARPTYVLESRETSDHDGTGAGAATVVHHVAEAELYGPMRLFRPVVAWMAARERTRTLASLQRALAPQPQDA